ncbi:MAG: methyltransferase domain-containing protein, partial [Pseudonocardiaceae bacterium]
LVEAEDGRPVLVAGDFNLAPRPEDGRCDGLPSSFNSDVDRIPFIELLARTGLVDCTAEPAPVQYSLWRMVGGKVSEFRCDLVLLADCLRPSVRVAYDTSVRASQAGFTDHSALLIDLPVTPETRAQQDSLFDLCGPSPAADQPHKTAMSRGRPSPFARAVAEALAPALKVASVLDHGCGRGADVRFYRDRGLDAEGWDPHSGFGWQQEPQRQFDLVTSVFVVLPNPWERIKALQHAARFMRPGGRLLVVTRSPHDIDRRAAVASWTPYHDGYWSSEGKRTFQRGIRAEEIAVLGQRAGLVVSNRSVVSGTLNADGLTVAGGVFLGEGSRFTDIRLLGGDISALDVGLGSVVSCTLTAGRATVAGDVFLRGGSQFKHISLVGADIGGLIRLDGAKWGLGGSLDLGQAHAGGLGTDITDSFPAKLGLNGFVFEQWANPDPGKLGAGWFTGVWLDRLDAFSPGPYNQLAAVMDAGGHPTIAADIRYSRSHEERRAVPWSRPDWWGRWLYWLVLGYGLRPWWGAGVVLRRLADRLRRASGASAAGPSPYPEGRRRRREATTRRHAPMARSDRWGRQAPTGQSG